MTNGSVTQPASGGPRPFRLQGHVGGLDAACAAQVTLTVGTLRAVLPGVPSTIIGECDYVGPHNSRGAPLTVSTVPSDGTWSANGADLPRSTNLSEPVAVGLDLGDRSGSTTVRLARRGTTWHVVAAIAPGRVR